MTKHGNTNRALLGRAWPHENADSHRLAQLKTHSRLQTMDTRGIKSRPRKEQSKSCTLLYGQEPKEDSVSHDGSWMQLHAQAPEQHPFQELRRSATCPSFRPSPSSAAVLAPETRSIRTTCRRLSTLEPAMPGRTLECLFVTGRCSQHQRRLLPEKGAPGAAVELRRRECSAEDWRSSRLLGTARASGPSPRKRFSRPLRWPSSRSLRLTSNS